MSYGDSFTVHLGLSTHPPLLFSWSFFPSISTRTFLPTRCVLRALLHRKENQVCHLHAVKTASVSLQRHLCTCHGHSWGHLCAPSWPSLRAHELACEKPSQHTQQPFCRYWIGNEPHTWCPCLSLPSRDIIVSKYLLSSSCVPDTVLSTVCAQNALVIALPS